MIKFPKRNNLNELKLEVDKKDQEVLFDIKGEKAAVSIADLYSFALTLFTPEQLETILVDTLMSVTEYTRQLTVKAEKDIKQGEEIVVRYKVVVPEIIKQKILNENNN